MSRVSRVGQIPVLEAKAGRLWKIPHLQVIPYPCRRGKIEPEREVLLLARNQSTGSNITILK